MIPRQDERDRLRPHHLEGVVDEPKGEGTLLREGWVAHDMSGSRRHCVVIEPVLPDDLGVLRGQVEGEDRQ